MSRQRVDRRDTPARYMYANAYDTLRYKKYVGVHTSSTVFHRSTHHSRLELEIWDQGAGERTKSLISGTKGGQNRLLYKKVPPSFGMLYSTGRVNFLSSSTYFTTGQLQLTG